jgi:hypothetical protein
MKLRGIADFGLRIADLQPPRPPRLGGEISEAFFKVSDFDLLAYREVSMKYCKEKSDQVAVSPKKVYRTPKLTVHGTVKKITAGEPPGGHKGKPKPGGNDAFSDTGHS